MYFGKTSYSKNIKIKKVAIPRYYDKALKGIFLTHWNGQREVMNSIWPTWKA